MTDAQNKHVADYLGWLRGYAPYWIVLTDAYHEIGDYQRELQALGRWRQLHPDPTSWGRVDRRALGVERRAWAALGRVEELGDDILTWIQRGYLSLSWFDELRLHGYPEAASDLVDQTLEWFENRTSPWTHTPTQPSVYAGLLARAGRWDEAQAVLEDAMKIDWNWNGSGWVPGPTMLTEATFSDSGNQYTSLYALGLAYVLANQGHRDQAYRALGLIRRPNDPFIRAGLEAALGERERAMRLLRESGYEPWMHVDRGYEFWPLRDYPAFKEWLRPTG